LVHLPLLTSCTRSLASLWMLWWLLPRPRCKLLNGYVHLA
jgi:hypothetical protein